MSGASKNQFVVSNDGTKIWAQAKGDPSKPAVVFIHGFSCTGLHFSKQFSDPSLLKNLYLVGITLCSSRDVSYAGSG